MRVALGICVFFVFVFFFFVFAAAFPWSTTYRLNKKRKKNSIACTVDAAYQ